MARIQIENGPRNAQVDEYKGRKIEVATGYDANSDKYPVHIYIDGTKVVGKFLADRIGEGFDLGFSVAAQEIDRQ